ncbi:MAG: DEAD/DEAH box helicase [Candidatus Thermoplasmatota archaeon]
MSSSFDWLISDFQDYRGQVAFSTFLPGDEADHEESEMLHQDLREKLSRRDIELYSHQARTIDEFLDGENVCLTTGTASGKTLAYALCAAHSFYVDDRSTFLALFPTKALTRDQKVELEEIFSLLDLDVQLGIYDGDVNSEQKKEVREKADMILTNFTGLNLYLNHHDLWGSFYERLKGIVIDEAHHYTGLFGMHVAWIVRRLRRVAGYYARKPKFILSSATLGNPEEHSKNLVGKDFSVVEEDGSGSGSRELIFWDPPELEDELMEKKSTHRESSDLLAHLVNQRLQTLMFAPSRKMAELDCMWARERLEERYGDVEGKVVPYHAGHTKEKRRETEEKLKRREVDGVVSTTALQLGINIGSIDATILSGYPGSRIDFWQQVGRAGRGSGSEGENVVSVLVPFNSSLDQYVVENPDHLLEKSIEDAVIDLSNNKVFSKHLLAAAAELPLREEDIGIFPPKLRKAAEMWKDEGSLYGDLKTGCRYARNDFPQQYIDLYSAGEDTFEVYLREENEEVESLPEIEKNRAYRDFHLGAIYLHRGKYYKVVEFNKGIQSSVVLEPVDTDHYTVTLRKTDIYDIESEDVKEIGDVKLHKGRGTVSIHYFSYKKKKLSNDNVLGTEYTGLEPITLNTHLIWVEVPGIVEKRVKSRWNDDESSSKTAYEGALHAAEHGLINMLPVLMLIDERDVGGMSTKHHHEVSEDGSAIFLYDGVEGGVGFVHDAYGRFEELAEKAKERFENCSCGGVKGCPACTFSSNCGNDNEPLNRVLAIDLLENMMC